MYNMSQDFAFWYMPIVPILIIAILIYLFSRNNTSTLSAQDILDKRYANGGMDRDEYLEKSRNILDTKEGKLA